MKKVLFVVTDRKMGGVSVVLEDIINNLPKNKYQIDILILNNEGNRIVGKIDKSINIIYGDSFFRALDIPLSYFKKHFNLPLLINKLHLIFLLKTGLIKKKLLKERKKILSKKYDVEVAFKDGFPAIFTAVGDTPKKIHFLHSTYKENDPTRRYRKTFHHIYDKFNNIVAVSNETVEAFNEYYGNAEKCVVIKNIIDVKKVKLMGKNPKKLSNKKINFISVGRLAKAKGYDRLLEVIYRIKKDNLFNDCFLTIVGDGPEKESLNKLKNNLGLESCVNLVGNQANPYAFMSAADLYISSARVEPFGLVMVESLILGVPVLAVETSATSVIIDNGKNGIITDNSITGLYNSLKEILKNRDMINKLKNNAKTYDYQKINDETIKIIDNILSK